MIVVRFLRQQWVASVLVATFLCIGLGSTVLHVIRGTVDSLPMEGHAYNFTLVNQTGDTVALHDSTGKVRLVSFIYTRCNASCPVVTAQMVQLQHDLARKGLIGNDVELMSITMDPSYDTESVLRKYQKQYGVAPVGWESLTGTHQAIDKTLTEYGVYAKKIDANQYVHTVAEFLIDKQGNIRKVYGMDLSAQRAVKDIDSLLHVG